MITVIETLSQQVEHRANVSLDPEHRNELDGGSKKHDDICRHYPPVKVIVGCVDELRCDRQIQAILPLEKIGGKRKAEYQIVDIK